MDNNEESEKRKSKITTADGEPGWSQEKEDNNAGVLEDITDEDYEKQGCGTIPGLVEFHDGREEWVVEKVIGKKLVGGMVHYRVKWWGWAHKYNTWEPVHFMKNSKETIRTFEKQLKLELKKREQNKATSFQLKTTKHGCSEEVAGPSTCKIGMNGNELRSNEDVTDCQVETRFGQLALTEEDFIRKNFVVIKTEKEWDSADSVPNDSSSVVSDTASEDDDVILIESEEDDEENDPEFLRSESLKWGPSFPLVRYSWKPEEEPLCVLGSALFMNTLHHTVRLKNPQDPEDVLENPYRGITTNNLVIIASKVFRYAYPQILIKYYENNLTPLMDVKSEEEQAEYAARNRMVKFFQGGNSKSNSHRILEDNMPSDQRLGEKELARIDKRLHEIFRKERKSNENDEQCLTPRDENGRIMYHLVKDDYGLPFYYGEEVEEEDLTPGGNYMDSSSDDEYVEHVPVPLKKPRTKNRPKYELVRTRPFPNLPGIDRLCYRRIKE